MYVAGLRFKTVGFEYDLCASMANIKVLNLLQHNQSLHAWEIWIYKIRNKRITIPIIVCHSQTKIHAS